MSRESSHTHPGHGHPTHGEHDHPGLSVAVEKAPGKAKVQVTIAADELERARGREFAELSRRVTLKGFRPGKTPRALLEKHYGTEVERGVLEHFLQHAYQKAVDEHSIRPAAYPRIPLEGNMPKRGEPWSTAFEILLRPEIELGQVEGLEIEGRPSAVGEEELERTLVEIRQSNSRAEPAGDEPLSAEGLAVATLDFFRPEATESCLSRAGIRIAPRTKTPPLGVDPDEFERTLVGARAGEQRSMSIDFPESFPVEAARGERGSLRFTLTEVLRIVPPTDQELFEAFGASDAASLRAVVLERMQKAKQEAEDQRIEGELLERLLAAHPLEIPAQLVEDQVDAHETELVAKLMEQGLAEEEARTRAGGERERSRVGAEKALRAIYLIEEIARAKELRVTQEDIGAELAEIARRNGTRPEEVAAYYKEQGLLRQLGLEMLERKVRRYLRTSAAIHTAT
jgi:trigger factor